MRNKNLMIIVSMLLFVFVIAINNVTGENTSINLPEKNDELDFLSESEKAAMGPNRSPPPEPEIIKIYGKVPEFETEEQMWNWNDVELHEIITSLRNETDQYFYPRGPIVYIGRMYDGYIEVAIYRNLTVEEQQLDEIYGIFDEEAKKRGINDIPVRFVLSDLPQLLVGQLVESNDSVLKPAEKNDTNISTDKKTQSSSETPGKFIPGFKIFGGLTALLIGWLFRK